MHTWNLKSMICISCIENVVACVMHKNIKLSSRKSCSEINHELCYLFAWYINIHNQAWKCVMSDHGLISIFDFVIQMYRAWNYQSMKLQTMSSHFMQTTFIFCMTVVEICHIFSNYENISMLIFPCIKQTKLNPEMRLPHETFNIKYYLHV